MAANLPQRRSIRLAHYDYRQAGAYFVTICARVRRCVFGGVVDRSVLLSPFGRIARDCWIAVPDHFDNVELDYFQVMPNHVHGILLLANNHTGTACRAPTDRQFGQPVAKSVGTILGAYKAAVTRRVNALRRTPGARLWQANYYEHIIRSERELAELRRYIDENPVKWALDRENPAVAAPDDDLPWEQPS